MEIGSWLDFAAAAAGASLSLEYSRAGIIRSVLMTRDPCRDWGVIFDDQKPRLCRNNCIFCFVDQQPPGLRDSLLVKDDDVRYSFFQGTYVTLDEDQALLAIDRRLSPIHVSVHATDPSVRALLLGRSGAVPIVPMLRKLATAGIEVEAQIVVVPTFNDGEILEDTIRELFELDCVTALGVVPVGLTDWRSGLVPLRRPDSSSGGKVIDLCERFRKKALAERGVGWVYAADEFFLMANRELPGPDYYLGCDLASNGIGLLTAMLEENRERRHSGSGTVCTGTLAYGRIREVLQGTCYDVLRIENTLFGNPVGVAGLLGGMDIVRQLSGIRCRMPVYLPGVMFNHDNFTLDDLSPGQIEKKIGKRIAVVDRISSLP